MIYNEDNNWGFAEFPPIGAPRPRVCACDCCGEPTMLHSTRLDMCDVCADADADARHGDGEDGERHHERDVLAEAGL